MASFALTIIDHGLSGRAPFFGLLVDGKVSIKGTDGEVTDFAVHGGFLSIFNNRVSILTGSVN